MDYLKTDDICKMFQITRRTVERWRKNGLPSIKIGKVVRFDKVAVEKWL